MYFIYFSHPDVTGIKKYFPKLEPQLNGANINGLVKYTNRVLSFQNIIQDVPILI